jgi:hypothetical protein
MRFIMFVWLCRSCAVRRAAISSALRMATHLEYARMAGAWRAAITGRYVRLGGRREGTQVVRSKESHSKEHALSC